MDRITKAVFLILIAISLDRCCTLITFWKDVYLYQPFPLYDLNYEINGVTYHVINLQVYIKAITVHLSWIIMLFAVQLALPVVCINLLNAMIIIEFVSLADFFLIYEQGLFYIGKYHVEFTDFRILGHAIAILLWKAGKL